MTRKLLTWMAAIAACVVGCGTANATANLLVNSDFSDYTLKNDPTNNGSFGFGDLTPQGKVNNVLTGWNTTGYNFLMTPGSATTVGSLGIYGSLKLYGPGNGINNGYVDAPSGHNYIAADAGLHLSDLTGTAAITQVVNNLVIGQVYALTFDWATAQQQSYHGDTTEMWFVSFGTTGMTDTTLSNMAGTDETYRTPIIATPDQGFTGWYTSRFLFTATGTTQTLSFLANGTPEGQPPFSLLADPTLQAVPEPATWAMMLFGFGAIGAVVRGRRRPVLGRKGYFPQAV